jgi:hypothetical protein
MDIAEGTGSRTVVELVYVSAYLTGSEMNKLTWWRVVLVGDEGNITLDCFISWLKVEVR